MSDRVLTILLALFIPLGCVGVVVSAFGGLYALAALNAALTGFVVFLLVRHFLRKDRASLHANKSLLDRLFDVPENLDPIKAASGQLVIFAVLLVIVIDGSGGLLWPLVTIIVVESVWLVGAVLHRRSRERAKASRRPRTGDR